MNPLETSPSDPTQLEAWEAAPIPGTVESMKLEDVSAEREAELLALIHDLNQCNDVLLSRVTQLEGALEQSQLALNTSARQAQATTEKMTQQVSQQAQQQIAKLVDQLDTVEQALSRQRLISENLQTEVDNRQEQISQLERECTVMAQQHLEEVQAKTKAEAVSKDLRSRLQRQQRYTMQFKAALEKSLTVTAKPVNTTLAQPIAFKDSSAVVMPKAQRIMPWVSDNSSPFTGIDPHLESLIRGAGKSTAQTEHNFEDRLTRSDAVDSGINSSQRVTNLEAEARLWQDLERVMNDAERQENSATEEPVEAPVSDDVAALTVEMPKEISTTLVTAEANPIGETNAEGAENNSLESVAASNSEKETHQSEDLIHQIETSFVAAKAESPELEVAFTEPSPWGKPLSDRAAEGLEKLAAVASDNEVSQDSQSSVEEGYLPAADSRVGESVSPLVKPLRSQKKSSLSNIELPTFHNAKVASFRR